MPLHTSQGVQLSGPLTCRPLQAIDDLSDCRRVYSEPATLSLVAVFHSVSTFGDLAPKLSLNVLGAVVLVASD